MTHSSDCALHNAPAAEPQPCSCGASRRFRIFRYDINNDAYRWRSLCRTSLLVEVAGGALSRCYGGGRMEVRTTTLITRAARCGFTDIERARILAAWGDLWTPTSDLLVRAGIDDVASEESGAFVSPEVRAELCAAPDDEEIASAIALWSDYWATLPEPVISLAGLRAA